MKTGVLCLSSALFALSVPAMAQPAQDPAPAAPAPAPKAPEAEPTNAPSPEAPRPEDGKAAPPTDTPTDGEGKPLDDATKKKHAAQDKFGTSDEEEEKKDLENDPDATRYYLGARFRDFLAPGFLFSIFADGGPELVNVFSGGPEFVLQSGALDVIFSVTVPYADYSMNEFVFKSKSDPDQAYEVVSSSLKLISATVDLLGRIKLEKNGTVALLIGGGAGISGVVGDITREQAYPLDPNNVDPKDPAKWRKCKGPGDPAVTTPDGSNYCGTDNDHYDGYTEPSWVDGGSKPVVFPYLALPHIAFEFVPIEEFLIRVDGGFSITGFFFGLGAGGKLPI